MNIREMIHRQAAAAKWRQFIKGPKKNGRKVNLREQIAFYRTSGIAGAREYADKLEELCYPPLIDRKVRRSGE